MKDNQDQLLEQKWIKVKQRIYRQFKKNPDINAVLFLIGIRELGMLKKSYSKDEKLAVLHVAVCRLLEPSGYFRYAGTDKDGWPHFKQLKPLPKEHDQQEKLLKQHIVAYFENL